VLQTDEQDHPDKDVRHDPTGQIVTVNSNGAIPEQRHQSPSVRSGDGRKVHESGQSPVSPICNGHIDEVDGENDLSPPEVVTSPQQDPDNGEDVVEDEVSSDVSGSRHDSGVLVEQVPNIAELGEEQKDPGDGQFGVPL
jgi:hypothetical protein